jgi:hypothetical protein
LTYNAYIPETSDGSGITLPQNQLYLNITDSLATIDAPEDVPTSTEERICLLVGIRKQMMRQFPI